MTSSPHSASPRSPADHPEPARGTSAAFETLLLAILLLAFAAARGVLELNLRNLGGSLEASFLPHFPGLGRLELRALYYGLWVGTFGLGYVWLRKNRQTPWSFVFGALIFVTLGGFATEVLTTAAAYRPDQNWAKYTQDWLLVSLAPQCLWLPFLAPEWRRRFQPAWRDAAVDTGFLILGAALALIVTLGYWRSFPASVVFRWGGKPLAHTTSYEVEDLFCHVEMTMAVLWLGLTPVLWWGVRRLRSAWSRASTIAATAATLAYLAWDDSSITALNPADILPPLSAQEAESAAVLRSMPEPDPKLRTWLRQGGATHPDNGIEWRLFVVAHREEIFADLSAPSGGVAWLERLDNFERLGDDSLEGQRATPVRWMRFRDLARIHAAYALLLTIDGHDDEALALIRRLLSVGQKMRRGARSVVPFATGTQIQAMVQSAVDRMLEIGTFRRDALEKFVDLLQSASRPGDITARIWQAELQTWVLPGLSSELAEYSLANRAGPLQRLFFLPNATSNTAIAQYRRVASVIEEGRGEERRSVMRARYEATFRNAIGNLMVSTHFPEFDRLLNLSWRVEDQRRALLAKIQAKLDGAAAESSRPPP